MIKTHAAWSACRWTGEMVEKLGLPMMTQKNGAQYGTNFTVSIEAAHGITTGISAADRALTIQTAVSPSAKPEDIVHPAHIFLLRAQKAAYRPRRTHRSRRRSGTNERPDSRRRHLRNHQRRRYHGAYARTDEVRRRTQSQNRHHYRPHRIPQPYRKPARRHGQRTRTNPWGEFQQHVYVDKPLGETHLALVRGTPSAEEETLVRVHEPFSVMDFIQPTRAIHGRCPKPLSASNKPKAA